MPSPPDEQRTPTPLGTTTPSLPPEKQKAAAGEPPPPSLPKGGGAIRGIGEKFTANAVTGTSSATVPLAVSPGRAGFQPGMTLAYDSGAGSSAFGHGFQLAVPNITRKADKGLPRYDDANESDVFILSGAEDLVPKERFDDGAELVTRYAPRVEGAFVRIERRIRKSDGVVYWSTTTPGNVTSVYGRSAGARIASAADPPRVFSWLLEETRDDRGNVIVYRYKAEDLTGVPRATSEANRLNGTAPVVNRYLKRVRYGNTVPFDATAELDSAVFELVFDYGEHDANAPTLDEAQPWPCRQDPFSTYRAAFEIRTYRLCRRTLMFHKMAELGATPCLVASTELTYAEDPVLTKLIAVTHSGWMRDPQTLAYTRKSHPPVELAYSMPQLQATVHVLDEKSTADLPEGVRRAYQWTDLDGEALPGVLSEQAGALYYKQNLGAGVLAPGRLLLERPALVGLAAGVQQVTDLDGDGRKELTTFAPPGGGFYARTDDGRFESFRPFPAQAFMDWDDPDLRLIDLDGDGFEDLLIVRAETMTWYRSLAKGGFAPPITMSKPRDEERGPALVFGDADRSIFLADMSGDGLTDLVRVENGSICYWPNLGYGRFGARVQLGGDAWLDEPDRFDARRVRLADVDGSGTTDILYLHEEEVRLYFNQAGNKLAPAVALPRLPDTSDLSAVTTIDLLGSGTACLVWSTALPGRRHEIRYIDLLGTKKPYLLTSIKNNLGLETHLEYAPSTRFYRADAEAGRPWVTRLPFPVQVLTRVETWDAVSRHRFVSTFAYHHGYFDGGEREFRGFGLVEQWDTESYSRFSGMGELPPPANASDPEQHLPLVRTKTWFHTGASTAAARQAAQYASEYYAGDPQAPPLPPTVFADHDLTAAELREACRALKGAMLRQEIYCDDGSPQAPHPYTVSTRSYEVRRLVPIAGSSHAVFLTHPREAIDLHYERDPGDPRTTHALTLEVDGFGTVLRSAAVGYPRRAAQASYPEQQQPAITLTEADVVHHAPVLASGWYRLALPSEARGYELTGIAPPPDGVFSFAAVLAAADNAAPIAYEATPNGTVQKRLLSRSRTTYYKNDLSGALPFPQLESLAIPYQTFTQAFSQALLDDVLQGRATSAILAEGGYVQLAGDPDWWIPSARQVPSPAEFYQPVSFLDPFGNPPATLAYDAYHLFTEQAIDPVQNVVSVVTDYRVLAPFEITDANGNRSRAAYDALGLVTATAILGKAGANDGDTLDDPTVSFDYDLDRYRLSGKPVVAHTRAREQHGAANTRWQESWVYSDGAGNEMMRKVQAEAGDVPQVGLCDPRYVGTGRAVLDNKGNPIKKYEPYFSAHHDYEDEPDLVQSGVTPILRYDPVGRLIRTDLPDGTFSTVTFTPWQEVHADGNDNVLASLWYQARQGLPPGDPEAAAAQAAAAHAGTPSIAHLDALGRTFLTIDDNGPGKQYESRVALDVEGNTLSITDARGVLAQQHRFAMGKVILWQKNSDGGERWALSDVAGALLRRWDGRKFTRRALYDAARRPTHLLVTPDGAAEQLVERTVYGEALGANAAADNHRGRVYQRFDGAGVSFSAAYDFKGNLRDGRRRLAKQYQDQPDWQPIAALPLPDLTVSPANDLLDGETFTVTTEYDALNRPTRQVTPDQSAILPSYNEAGLLARIDVQLRGSQTITTFVDDFRYNARREREKIVYGHTPGKRSTTTYQYHPLTFRLQSLQSQRELDGALLQDLQYTHDPVGNVTAIADGAQQTVYFNNAVVTPSTSYVYDAVYRLIQAAGRELAGGVADEQRDDRETPQSPLPHPNDQQAQRNYVEKYVYDEVGNLSQMVHLGGNPGSWTRRYNYEADASNKPLSNRLIGTSMPQDPPGVFSAPYTYDAHGNMLSMPHLPALAWNYHDALARADKLGGGTVYFTYDAGGQRVRKVYEHSGLIEERIYLGGWEIYRKSQAADPATPVFARETLHVMDGVRRVALVETKAVDTSGPAFTPAPVIRYQLDNHLSSALLELDADALVISYEEYHPYGTTSYRSSTGAAEVSAKRYRYTGKERDDETSLYYHGARYYAAWLGRWTAADPQGLADGVNLYRYCRDNPIRLKDPNGTTPNEEQTAILNNLKGLTAQRTMREEQLAKATKELEAVNKYMAEQAPEIEGQAKALRFWQYKEKAKLLEPVEVMKAKGEQLQKLINEAETNIKSLDPMIKQYTRAGIDKGLEVADVLEAQGIPRSEAPKTLEEATGAELEARAKAADAAKAPPKAAPAKPAPEPFGPPLPPNWVGAAPKPAIGPKPLPPVEPFGPPLPPTWETGVPKPKITFGPPAPPEVGPLGIPKSPVTVTVTPEAPAAAPKPTGGTKVGWLGGVAGAIGAAVNIVGVYLMVGQMHDLVNGPPRPREDFYVQHKDPTTGEEKWILRCNPRVQQSQCWDGIVRR